MLNRKSKKTKQSGHINLKPDSTAMEQYKNIRANIEFLEIDKKFHTIIVTSSEAGVGKTTTALHLAKAFAQKGEKTLLIGADLRKPALSKIISGDTDTKNSGLVSLILKKTPVEESIVKSEELNDLSFLLSGFIPPNPAELLESNSMESLMNYLKTKYDRIIIDSPPLMPVVDSKILSKYSDGIILVVRSEYSEKEALEKTINEVNNMPIKMLGFILNAVDAKDKEYYYYY